MEEGFTPDAHDRPAADDDGSHSGESAIAVDHVQKVTVRLVLICHGDTVQKGKLVGDLMRPMSAQGWTQVTRTAWALRLHPEFAPGLILSSTETSCEQAAARVQSILGDDDDDLFEPEPTPPPGAIAERRPRPPQPQSCGALTFPGYWKSCGPESYRVSDAIIDAAKQWDLAEDVRMVLMDDPPQDPPAIMLVGCGHLLETALACLTAQSRLTDEQGGRFGGGAKIGNGDAVMVQSPPLECLAGEEGSLLYKATSALWEEALLLPNWIVVKHIRGSGVASERPGVLTDGGYISAEDAAQVAKNAELAAHKLQFEEMVGGSLDAANDDHDGADADEAEDGGKDAGEDDEQNLDDESPQSGDAAIPRTELKKKKKQIVIDPMYVSNYGLQWRQYAGEPLIFSHHEFSCFAQRAGSAVRPPAAQTLRAMWPLVKDVSLEPIVEDDTRSSSLSSLGGAAARRRKMVRAPTGSLPNLQEMQKESKVAVREQLLSARSNKSSRSNRSGKSNRSAGSKSSAVGSPAGRRAFG